VKATQRHAAVAVGFLALSLSSAPLMAQRIQEPPQRGGPPNQNTPYILVAAFHSTDRELGVSASDELRHRIQSEHSAKDLYVVPKNSINSTLQASGYPADSALSSADLMELSKQLHGTYVVDGTVAKTGQGKDAVRVDVKVLLRTGTNTLAQPLPTANGKDPGDAAKMVERSISEMLKGMPMYDKCIENLRAAKLPDAITSARAGIAAYPNSVLSRICLLNAYVNQKAPPDTIISVASQILTYDPASMLALANLADAYSAKGDKDKAIETNLKIYRVDPTNAAIAQSIVQQLAQSGAPDKALPIIDSLIKDNPADVGMIRTKWLLQLNAKQFKNAIATGEELVKLDTASANLDYFNRQIGAAQADSNVAKVQELATKAGQKFSKEISFPLLLAQSYLKSGQTQQAIESARRASAIQPSLPAPWLFQLFALNQLGQTDSVLTTAQRAIAAGVPKDSLAQSLLTVLGPALKKAQESKARADWEAALQASQAVDAIAPSPQTKFYTGVAAFSVAMDALQNVQAATKKTAKDERAKGCAELKVVEDNFATTQMTMPAGGSVDKETAGTILNGVNQYSPYIPQFKKALACK